MPGKNWELKPVKLRQEPMHINKYPGFENSFKINAK